MQKKENTVIGVDSRKDFIEGYEKYPKDAVLIGIWSPGDMLKLYNGNDQELNELEKYNSVVNHFKDTIIVDFWDTENNVPGYPSIDEKTAISLIKFIDKHMDSKFVIHCDAGQSRSAGTSMAVECIVDYFGDKYTYSQSNKFVDTKPEQYSPNRYVYDKIMETYEKVRKGELEIYEEHPVINGTKLSSDNDPIGSNPFMTSFD